MKNNQSENIRATSIGVLAKQYRVCLRTFCDLINVNEGLKEVIEPYTRKAKQKGKKILPPIVIEKIYEVLGRP